MAVRRGRRDTFFSPAKVSCDRRGRVTTWTPGISASISGRMVAGADEQRLLAPALVQEAVGEHMAAVEIAGELDLVHGHEGEIEIARHRLDGGDPVARPVRLDLLLAGDEGDVVVTPPSRPRGCRPRGRAGAGAGRSCRCHGRACARWRDGSCRYWWGRARRSRRARAACGGRERRAMPG